MTRSPAQRLLAILLAALFSLGGEGTGLLRHACPHHDLGGAAGIAAPRAVADSGGEGGNHAGHGAHAAASSSTGEAHAPDNDGGHSGHGDGACTCPGACEAGAGKTLPSVSGAVVRIAVTGDSERASPPHRAAPRGPTPYLLPYAHAPPRAG